MEDKFYDLEMAKAEKRIPKKYKHLPVYFWDDYHDYNEWICVSSDGSVIYFLGHDRHVIVEAEEKSKKRKKKK